MDFGRQQHQVEEQFRTPLFKVRNPQSIVRKFRTPQTNMRNWNSACENWIFLPTLFLLIFLCLNFHFLLVFNHSCNSLARKYPRKGKLPSYINSLVNTLRRRSGKYVIYRYIIYRINEQSTCSVFHIYSCLLFHFHFLANQTLRIFPQRMRG